MSNRSIGLIAGNSQFPILIARAARQQGVRVVAVAHRGETLPELEQEVDKITWIYLGQLTKLIAALKKEGIKETLMCGGITKTRMFSDVKPDLKALILLKKIKHLADDKILRLLAQVLANEKIIILPSQELLPNLLAVPKTYTKRKLNKNELASAKLGWIVANEIGRLDIGQTVIVKNRVIVAVEAIEGTDSCIHRSAKLVGAGTIVVKRCKLFQDKRFDLPSVGIDTIKSMVISKCSALVIEAGKTLVFDYEKMVNLANTYGINITAWDLKDRQV